MSRESVTGVFPVEKIAGPLAVGNGVVLLRAGARRWLMIHASYSAVTCKFGTNVERRT